MTKKKGWVEPEKPAIPQRQESKKVIFKADNNELYDLFDRRSKGENIARPLATREESSKELFVS